MFQLIENKFEIIAAFFRFIGYRLSND